jgi:sec-independent protein translocase protein TatA
VPVLGFWDLLIIAFLVLLVFGPKRLPQMGRSLGGMFRGFKDSVTGRIDREDAKAEEEEKARAAALPPARPQQQVLPPGEPAHDPRERDTVL